MMILLKKFSAPIIGGICGYLYYRYIGCSTGHCPITSSPVGSTIYGILLGSLLYT